MAYAMVQLSDALEEAHLFLVFPHVSVLFPPLVFTLEPLIYLYVRALTSVSFRFKWRFLLHFVPFLILVVLLTPYYLLSASQKIEQLKQKDNSENDLFVGYIGIIQVSVYFVISLKAIRKYSKDIKDYFSATDKMSLNWLRNLLFVLILIWAVWLLNTLYTSLYLKYAEAVLFTWFVYNLGFKGLNQPGLFKFIPENIQPLQSIIKQDNADIKKYEKSGFPAGKVEATLACLKMVMEVEKVYRNPDLMLADLAKLIAVSPHNLSQLLNDNFSVNFAGFDKAASTGVIVLSNTSLYPDLITSEIGFEILHKLRGL